MDKLVVESFLIIPVLKVSFSENIVIESITASVLLKKLKVVEFCELQEFRKNRKKIYKVKIFICRDSIFKNVLVVNLKPLINFSLKLLICI